MQAGNELRAFQLGDHRTGCHHIADISAEPCDTAGDAGADIDPIGRDLTLDDEWRGTRGKPQNDGKSDKANDCDGGPGNSCHAA
jgi:hypothetical protein